MKYSRKPFMRPIAWAASWLMFMLVEQISRLVCGIGEWAVALVSGWSTIAIIAVAILFGSLYVSLYFYSAVMIGYSVVFVSEFLYPSRKGARYWVFGIYEVLGCCFFVLMGILGTVRGGSMFWFYAKYLWLAVFAFVSLAAGVSEAQNRS